MKYILAGVAIMAVAFLHFDKTNKGRGDTYTAVHGILTAVLATTIPLIWYRLESE